MHIGTHPHGIVDAESKLTTMITKQLTTSSMETDDGLIKIPGSFTGMPGGVEQTNTGKTYILAWEKQEEEKEESKKIGDAKLHESAFLKFDSTIEVNQTTPQDNNETTS